MSNASPHVGASDPGSAAHRFFAFQELLATPELARFYTDLLINSPTTITAARDRQGLSKSTAYKYANTLEEMNIAEELDEHDNGSTLWRTDPVSGIWNSETAVTLSPTVIAVYGATAVDDDLALFVDRHGKAALAPAISATIEYLNGNTTRRGVAVALDVPAVEGIAVSQAIERIIGVVRDADPSLKDLSDAVEIHERAIEHAPYQRSNE
jgi:hypothetical protein